MAQNLVGKEGHNQYKWLNSFLSGQCVHPIQSRLVWVTLQLL
jgi:hypothetical protein